MNLLRRIPFDRHAAVESVAAPLVMTAPFVLGFAPGAAVATVIVGALLFTLSLAAHAEPRAIPVSDHATVDYSFALATIAIGLAFAIGSGDASVAVFLTGLGLAHVALTALTRFTLSPGT